MRALPGVSSTLIPEWYLTDEAGRVAQEPGRAEFTRWSRGLTRWWQRVEAACGPATGPRALFDIAGMPLFGMLGFRAANPAFDRGAARALLTTQTGRRVGLMIRPWSSGPSEAWRDVWGHARALDTPWCFVLAPPFLSLVLVRGQAMRHRVDFAFPQVLEAASAEVLWMLGGAQAFEPSPATPSGSPRIDILLDRATAAQERVRGDLRHGVAHAIAVLSRVIDRHAVTPRAHQALTLVYRVLFLKFAESHGAMPIDDRTYAASYAVTTLCRQAMREPAARGLWAGLAAATRLARTGCRLNSLAIAPFNGRLFARSAAPALEARRASARPTTASRRRDAAAREALLALGTRVTPRGREEVGFRDLDVEELGSVYERILDLHPEVATVSPTVARGESRVTTGHSASRKQTGTFYTPRALAEFVTARSLHPLVQGKSSEDVLALRIVDPAMGSGAFLIAACRYLADAYELALVDEGRLNPGEADAHLRAEFRRLVAERCLFGVDRNPVAVQLARLSLWLTTMARGKPLGFLDHRLRIGNSIVGASPTDLARLWTRRRDGPPLPLFERDDLETAMRLAMIPLRELTRRSDDRVEDVYAKERLWSRLNGQDAPLGRWRAAASTWCAQWFWPAGPDGPPQPAELRALVDAILRSDATLPAARLARRLAQADRAAREISFFHWPLEFPDVFSDADGGNRSDGGFDAVIGNPPWDMLRRDEGGQPQADGSSREPRRLLRFVRDSGLYTTCRTGHLNLYQPFVERALRLCRPRGEVGLVLPWSAAVDEGAAELRRVLLDTCRIRTLVGLDNTRGLFPVHRGLRFMAITLSPGSSPDLIPSAFAVSGTTDIESLSRDHDTAGLPVRLSPGHVRRIGGPERRVPYVRHSAELSLLDKLMTTFPALSSADSWGARCGRELNATDDRTAFGPIGLPVLDGKHVHPFRVEVPRAPRRIAEDMAARKRPDGRYRRQRVGYRDVSGFSNRRALIAAVLPANVLTTHTVFCLWHAERGDDALHFLAGMLNSHVLGLVVRALMGSHVTTSLVERLPIPAFTGEPLQQRIATSARRLSDAAVQTIEAHLQADVARLYGLGPAEVGTVVAGSRLSPEERDEVLGAYEDGRTNEHLPSRTTADAF